MAVRLTQSDADFEARFAALLGAKREVAEDVDRTVRGIVEEVRLRGDAALIAYTEKFDRLALTPDRLRISPDAMERPRPRSCPRPRGAPDGPRPHRGAPQAAGAEGRPLHRPVGVELGTRWTAIERSASMCRAAPPPIRPRC